MQFWNFITDETELRRFYDMVLKPLEVNEGYFLILAARKKYLEEGSTVVMSNTDVIERKIVRHYEFDRLVKNMVKLGIPENFYKSKSNEPYPYNSYVMYVTINPRDLQKAMLTTSQNYIKSIYDMGKSETELEKARHIDTIMFSEVQSAKGTPHYLDIDLDVKNEEYLNRVISIMGRSKLIVVETRGGYHILIDKNKIDNSVKNTFYRDLEKYSKELKLIYDKDVLEFKPDSMLPIPGTSQGGFTVRIKEIINEGLYC